MNWGEKGKRLGEIISPIYNPKTEMDLFKSVISALHLRDMSVDDIEKAVYGMYDILPSHSVERSEILQQLDLIVLENAPNGGLESLEDLLVKDLGNKKAVKVMNKVNTVISPKSHSTNHFELSDNTWIGISEMENTVNFYSFSLVKNERVTSTTKVLLCRPEAVTVHENPLANGKREFTVTWLTTNNTKFICEGMTQSEIENQLYESGYVVNTKYLKTAITSVIQIFIENDWAEIKNNIEADGFYYDVNTHKLVCVGYEMLPTRVDEVNESLLVIEELKHFFIGNEDKLATTLKHGLIAPFGFAKKQMGLPLELLVPYLYHYGRSGSGKTTIARIALWFYDKPNVDWNDIGGTEFDTVPRIGEQLKKFTYGLLVNEPETSLSKKSCAATLKTAVERTNSRQKFRGTQMEHILALSTVSFASNIPLPNIEGLPRRFVQILYSHNERKTEQEKTAFMKHFKLDNAEECEFNKLCFLSNFVVTCIYDDVDLLRLNWQDLGNELIRRAYDYIGREVPEWLLEYVESVTEDDLDDAEMEEIRMFFLSEVNRHSGQIKIYSSEDGTPLNNEVFYTEEVKDSSDFEDKVWNVINEGLIPYMVTKDTKGVREVCFTTGLKKVLTDNNIKCYSIESTSELLGWEYKPCKINGKTMRCMRVPFRKFLQFLYPNMEIEYEN